MNFSVLSTPIVHRTRGKKFRVASVFLVCVAATRACSANAAASESSVSGFVRTTGCYEWLHATETNRIFPAGLVSRQRYEGEGPCYDVATGIRLAPLKHLPRGSSLLQHLTAELGASLGEDHLSLALGQGGNVSRGWSHGFLGRISDGEWRGLTPHVDLGWRSTRFNLATASPDRRVSVSQSSARLNAVTLGGGISYSVLPRLSIDLAYRHDFYHRRFLLPPEVDVGHEVTFRADQAALGLEYTIF